MVRKVILDVDPGIDDAVALCMALFDPRLEVVAITATAGNVSAQQATRNTQAILEQLDPPRWPRIGMAREPDSGHLVDSRDLFGADGLGNANFDVAELHHRHDSDKVLCDEIRSAPEEITVITLGPLTNVARALGRDPELGTQMGQMFIRGGAIAVGNVTATAEFNIYSDPQSAQTVFRSATTKTLIPLDVTRQVVMTYDQLDQLPGESSRAGRFLRKVMPHLFRSYRNHRGVEGIFLHDAVAMVAALHPELFQTEAMAGDVEISGELTTGATVFDRREKQEWRSNMDVAIQVDVPAVMDCILRGLSAAGRA